MKRVACSQLPTRWVEGNEDEHHDQKCRGSQGQRRSQGERDDRDEDEQQKGESQGGDRLEPQLADTYVKGAPSAT